MCVVVVVVLTEAALPGWPLGGVPASSTPGVYGVVPFGADNLFGLSRKSNMYLYICTREKFDLGLYINGSSSKRGDSNENIFY